MLIAALPKVVLSYTLAITTSVGSTAVNGFTSAETCLPHPRCCPDTDRGRLEHRRASAAGALLAGLRRRGPALRGRPTPAGPDGGPSPCAGTGQLGDRDGKDHHEDHADRRQIPPRNRSRRKSFCFAISCPPVLRAGATLPEHPSTSDSIAYSATAAAPGAAAASAELHDLLDGLPERSGGEVRPGGGDQVRAFGIRRINRPESHNDWEPGAAAEPPHCIARMRD